MLFDPGSWSRYKYHFTSEEWEEFNRLSSSEQQAALAQKKAREEYELKNDRPN